MSKEIPKDKKQKEIKPISEIKEGFWIKPDTFYKNQLQDDLDLDDDVVIVEVVETHLDGRETPVYQKNYYYVEDNKAILSDKRGVTKKLKKQMESYMLEKDHWPPFSEIKTKYKNGKVKIAYTVGNWITFNIKLDATIQGEDTAKFLEDLEKYEELFDDSNEEDHWLVEHAKSGRAKCRSCGEKIDKEVVRIGKPDSYQGRTFYRWYHIDCASREGYYLQPVKGLDKLDEQELEELIFYDLINKE